MSMGTKEILNELYQKRCDDLRKELFECLTKLGISTHNPDGSWKSIQTLLNEIAEVWNKEK